MTVRAVVHRLDQVAPAVGHRDVEQPTPLRILGQVKVARPSTSGADQRGATLDPHRTLPVTGTASGAGASRWTVIRAWFPDCFGGRLDHQDRRHLVAPSPRTVADEAGGSASPPYLQRQVVVPGRQDFAGSASVALPSATVAVARRCVPRSTSTVPVAVRGGDRHEIVPALPYVMGSATPATVVVTGPGRRPPTVIVTVAGAEVAAPSSAR